MHKYNDASATNQDKSKAGDNKEEKKKIVIINLMKSGSEIKLRK